MSVRELAKMIGAQGYVTLGGLKVIVAIMDAKVSYGKTRYLVTPLSGSGSVWIDADRFTLWVLGAA